MRLRWSAGCPVAWSISEPTVHHARLESFPVHVRALAEFLIVHKGNAEKDFTVEDFGGQAPAPHDPRRERLEDVWTLTNLYDLRPTDYRTPEGHKGTAGQVLSLMEDFVVGLEAKGTTRTQPAAASGRRSPQ